MRLIEFRLIKGRPIDPSTLPPNGARSTDFSSGPPIYQIRARSFGDTSCLRLDAERRIPLVDVAAELDDPNWRGE
jgi:hypothetical protein